SDDGKKAGEGKKDVKPAEKKDERPAATAAAFAQTKTEPGRKRSNVPVFIALVGLVCAVGGYTIIRSKGGSDENKTAQPPVTTTTLPSLDAKKVYEVKLTMKGFHDWKVKLKPKAGDKIEAALVPNEKVVEVATTPAGAEVMLDGKRVGKTPFTIHKLDLTKAH